MPIAAPVGAALAACALLAGSPARAIAQPDAPQHAHDSSSAGPRAVRSFGLHGVALVTHASPAVNGESRTEGYLTQPVAVADLYARGGRLFAHLTLDFEGLTLRRGELGGATYGEGYVDRRHPHAYVHEALVGVRAQPGDLDVSLVAGRGFAPFGTDDPMMRPFVKYPVNHHLSQVLERLVVIGAARWRGLVVEGAAFNGDEPVGPGAPPRLDRFGDSWSARATAIPARGVELAASWAEVASPEEPTGEGLDQRKWNVSARLDRPIGPVRYALVERARTDERFVGRRAFRFSSTLAELMLAAGPALVGVRAEWTTRPEEERLLDPFRTKRPHSDVSIIGATAWDVLTANVAVPRRTRRALVATPFVEAAWLRPRTAVARAVFDPRAHYGASSLWNLSLGLRVLAGGMRHRMGRYGTASFGGPATSPAAAGSHAH